MAGLFPGSPPECRGRAVARETEPVEIHTREAAPGTGWAREASDIAEASREARAAGGAECLSPCNRVTDSANSKAIRNIRLRNCSDSQRWV